MKYFERIAEHNKALIKPLDSDMIYYSELQSFFSPHAFRSLSVKCVVDQEIRYRTDSKEFAVGAGRYLLACKHTDARAYFESQQTVRSLCIDICQESFAEAYTIITAKEDHFDNYLARYFSYPEFFENVNPLANDPVGLKLQSLLCQIQLQETDSLNKEWFLDLVEKIIYKEYGHYLALKNIHTAKPATRKEILSRLNTGKAYIDEHYSTIGEIKEVARHCLLSEYHFFRCFKQAFQLTPYQYLSQKKLEEARRLLAGTNLPVAEIALSCNYPDAFTFSKAYKRRYGVAPSVVRKQQKAVR